MKGVVCMSSLVSSLTFTSPAEIPHPRLSAQNRQQTGSILTSTTPSSGSDLKNWLSRQLCRLIHSCLPVSHSPRRGRDLVPNLVSCLRIPLIHLLRTRCVRMRWIIPRYRQSGSDHCNIPIGAPPSYCAHHRQGCSIHHKLSPPAAEARRSRAPRHPTRNW
jgi:hypothetical protein